MRGAVSMALAYKQVSYQHLVYMSFPCRDSGVGEDAVQFIENLRSSICGDQPIESSFFSFYNCF